MFIHWDEQKKPKKAEQTKRPEIWKTGKTGKLIEKESVTAALIVKKNRNTKFLNRMSIVQMFAFQLLGTLM